MNKDNSTLLVVFDSNKEIQEKEVSEIFKKIALLDKGIKFLSDDLNQLL